MDEVRAAYGLLQLRHLEKATEHRRKITHLYRSSLKGIEGISFFYENPNVQNNYSYFPILVDQKEFGLTRDDLYDRLKEHNIYGRRYFYPLNALSPDE